MKRRVLTFCHKRQLLLGEFAPSSIAAAPGFANTVADAHPPLFSALGYPHRLLISQVREQRKAFTQTLSTVENGCSPGSRPARSIAKEQAISSRPWCPWKRLWPFSSTDFAERDEVLTDLLSWCFRSLSHQTLAKHYYFYHLMNVFDPSSLLLFLPPHPPPPAPEKLPPAVYSLSSEKCKTKPQHLKT